MGWITGNYYLSEKEQQNNGVMAANYFSSKGWTIFSIAAILGNMESESTINPGIWQSLIEGSGGGGGFGLVQWTPWTNFTNWAESNGYEWTDGNAQCKWVDEQTTVFGQWIQTDSYPITFEEFKSSNETPEYLASAFLKNFERAGVEVESERITQARKWYNYLINTELSTYIPRLDSSGIEGNHWYYDYNPFYQSGYGLPNCTCYAWGRWGELMNEAPTLSLGNADTWIDRNTTYPVGQSPKLGAIAVWAYDGGGDGGHVAVVEQINEDGTIITSNSAWGGALFYTQTLKESDGYEWGSFTNFLGFIYYPYEFGFLPITKKNKKQRFKWVLFNKNRSVRT